MIEYDNGFSVDLEYLKSAKANPEGGEIIDGGELPEVIIVCGQDDGPCWDGYCHHEIGIFGLPMGYMICDTFTGQIEYSCVNDMPC